jgi:small membrane protein
VIFVQLILIAAVTAMAVLGLRSRATHGVNAWKKLLFAAMLVVVVIAVLFPAMVNRTANWVGVGRGTDLVLYVLAMAFGFYVVNEYLRGQDAREELHRLARRIALVEAAERYGLVNALPAPLERSEQPADEHEDRTAS